MVSFDVRQLMLSVKNAVVETVYPSSCAGCGERGVWLCADCEPKHLPLVSGLVCNRCGHPVIRKRCGCRNLHPVIHQMRAAAVFYGWPAESVRLLKYQGEKDRALPMARFMAGVLPEFACVDCIVPVPLHPDRENMRGYNQSRVLALSLSSLSHIPVVDAIERVRPTDTQTHRNREERLENMEAAFALKPGWTPTPGCHYLLLDDVFTTGATISACAECLEAAGVTSISALTFTLDLMPSELTRYREMLSAAE